MTFARAITHQNHLARSGRSLGSVRGVQWTFSIHSTNLLKNPIREQEIKLECMNNDQFAAINSEQNITISL